MKIRMPAGTSFVMLLILAVTTALFAADPIATIVPPGVLYEVLALNRDLSTPKKPKYNSPCAMVPSHDGKLLYIAQQTAKRIDVYAIEAKTVVKRIYLPDEVTGLAVSPDKMELYATCTSERWPAGKTCVVNLETGRVTAIITTGWGSCAPVVHPKGSLLYVCNRFSNDVSMVNLNALKETKRIAVSHEPCCAAITPDGAKLVVGNSMPDNLSVDTNDISCKVSLIDAKNGTSLKNIQLNRGSKSVQGVAVSADGKYAFVTHLIGTFNLVASTCTHGWLVTNNLTVIDLENDAYVNTTCLDLATVGMGNPWGVKCSKDGDLIVVAHAGCNRLSLIQYKPFIDTVLARTKNGINLQRDFTTMIESRTRIEVAVNNPRDVAIIGDKVFTAGYFSDSLLMVEIPDITDDPFYWPAEYISLGERQPRTAERKGEQLFYNAQLCFQNWQSCHSCHPNSRPDGYNWILGGGATQYPKNTRSLLYSWWTPPTFWSGRRGHARKSIPASIELELFMRPDDSIALPLDTFCMNLKPVQSPYRIKGRLSESAERGKILFGDSEVNCASCHSGPLFTDSLVHETTVTDHYDPAKEYVTPSLIEAWRTKPYGHIGSIGTVRDMINGYMAASATRQLTRNEIDDLTEYVLSL